MSGTLASLLAPGRLAVFLFHGVIPHPRPGIRNHNAKHLTTARFTQAIDELATAGAPMPLPEAVRALAGDAILPDRAFAVTFDDGFANNLSVAAPILAERRVPATFYLTTRFVDEDAPSWADLIDDAVERTDARALAVPGLDDPLDLDGDEARVVALDRLRAMVKDDPAVDPYPFARDVRARLGVGAFAPDPWLDAKLTWDGARALDRHPLFTVGGHGHTHRILAHLREDELRREVAESAAILARELGRPAEHWSYPEGTPGAHSPLVHAVMREHGAVSGVTTDPVTNGPGDDPMTLGRFTVT